MSHVDDGTLHAYLDGELTPAEAQAVEAHLAQCPDCRGRLEEERALIARAGELLALATPPDRALPPFRSGDVRPPRRLWWQVRLPVAWAATVLLALGIGTYLGSRSAASWQRVVTDQAGPVPAADSVAPVRSRAFVQRAVKRAPPVSLAEFSLDSARALLGREPVVLPGAPIRALRRAHLPGYAAAVVIEQQLDSGTVVQLVEGRRAEMRMDAVVAERVAAPSAAAERTRAPQAAAQAPAPIRPVRLVDQLEVTISGPLPLDSLTQLLRRVAPLKAQSVTGP